MSEHAKGNTPIAAGTDISPEWGEYVEHTLETLISYFVTLQADLVTIHADIEDLKARVTALEGA
jgi:hypothetical protein